MINNNAEKEIDQSNQSCSNNNSDISTHNPPKPELVKLTPEDQYNIYLSGLQSSIDQFKKMNPEKYEKSQMIGEDMMNKKYALTTGQDMKGDLLKCKNILTTIIQYGLKKDDLYESELQLLKKILVDVLNCIHDVEDIFSNIEEIENIIHIIVNKMCEFEHDY